MDSKFKVGDVLKFEDGLRGIVASVYPQATNSNEYLYDLWTCYKGAIDWDSWSESELVDKVKVMDHIDIFSVVGGEKSNERDDVEEKKELDKINSALSTLIGYDDLVLRVKVDADQVKQVKRMKIGEDVIEFETVDKKIRELQKENEGLKEEIDILKSKNNLLREKIERRERDIVNWKKGWYDCLDSFNYYLKA